MDKIIIPENSAQSEFSEKKSKFLSFAYPLQDETEHKSYLKQLRKEHPDSSHVVWAYILGDSGGIHGLSDDGEPHGTAGRPVLEVLKGSGLTYIALYVVRYFGGTKLGTGGLVSSYTQAAKNVLLSVHPTEKIEYDSIALTCPYTLYEGVKKILLSGAVRHFHEDFTDNVSIKGELPCPHRENITLEILNFTNGQVILQVLED